MSGQIGWGVVALLAVGCGKKDDTPEPIEIPCTPDQNEPYASGIPYLGVHADAGNSDVIACTTGSDFVSVWHSLEGLGLVQPNTFNPTGDVTYATTTNPDPDGCRLHAVDTATGDVLWCKTYGGTIGRSSVEVDSAGDLYFTVGSSVVSVTDTGEERWVTEFSSSSGDGDAPWGLHFTPQGHVATVTSSGSIYLINRADGSVASSLNIADAYGFVPPPPGSGIDLMALFPFQVQENITAVWGEYENPEDGPAFANFLGAGDFVDNTLAVATNGDLYVIGGGPTEDQGALVQIKLEGAGEAVVLTPGWATITHKGSATSPSISPGDAYVMISDGASSENQTNPGEIDARVKVVDIAACDANTDSDSDPARCGVAYEEVLERGAVPGSPAIDADGVVTFYEFGLDWSWTPEARDVVAFDASGVLWSTALPEDQDWMSVVTVTNNHVIGTATAVVPSDKSLGAVVFPQTSGDALVVLDRWTGEEVFSAPIPDDSAATVTVGPDGALYVGMYGLITVLTLDETPTLGLVRFSPTAE